MCSRQPRFVERSTNGRRYASRLVVRTTFYDLIAPSPFLGIHVMIIYLLFAIGEEYISVLYLQGTSCPISLLQNYVAAALMCEGYA